MLFKCKRGAFESVKA